jgi:hypothetical protein
MQSRSKGEEILAIFPHLGYFWKMEIELWLHFGLLFVLPKKIKFYENKNFFCQCSKEVRVNRLGNFYTFGLLLEDQYRAMAKFWATFCFSLKNLIL